MHKITPCGDLHICTVHLHIMGWLGSNSYSVLSCCQCSGLIDGAWLCVDNLILLIWYDCCRKRLLLLCFCLWYVCFCARFLSKWWLIIASWLLLLHVADSGVFPGCLTVSPCLWLLSLIVVSTLDLYDSILSHPFVIQTVCFFSFGSLLRFMGGMFYLDVTREFARPCLWWT